MVFYFPGESINIIMDVPTRSPQTTVTALDGAYEALNEVFPNHPLMPCVRMEYLVGTNFEAITRKCWGPTDERNGRVRQVKINDAIFWQSFKLRMKLSFAHYIRWVREIHNIFYRRLIESARDQGGGKEMMKLLHRIKQALIRDFRYFRFDEHADELDLATLEDLTGRPDSAVHSYVETLISTADERSGKPVKDGFALSKRLCNPYKPLLLKLYCDLIKGKEFLEWLTKSGELKGVHTKYRLFYIFYNCYFFNF